MYYCKLIDILDYTIIYKRDDKESQYYFGIDTQRKNIMLYNVRHHDYSTIELLLQEADEFYSPLYSNR